jgi:hypothetical protein
LQVLGWSGFSLLGAESGGEKAPMLERFSMGAGAIYQEIMEGVVGTG